MAAAKIKKGDQVIVLSGKDKGKTGTVTQAMPKDGKVIVGGVNIATRHAKPSQADPQAACSVSRRRCTCPRWHMSLTARRRACGSKCATERRFALR